jgi:uncharacterized Zn-binding protein involved in type VI secretion
MPGFLCNAGTVALCPHVTIIPSSAKVLLSGQPAATIADKGVVAGCGFQTPCVAAQWLVPATKVLINGVPALLNTSTGACLPAGVPIITATQPKVSGI